MHEFSEVLTTLPYKEILVAWIFLVAVWNWFRQRKPYAVVWSHLLDISLLNRRGWTTDDFNVSIRGTAVQHPRLVVVSVRNLGKEPVKPIDFDGPINIEVMGGSGVVHCEFLSKNVKVENPNQQHVSTIAIAPTLLNPGDLIVVRMLVDSEQRTRVKVVGRLAGVIKLRETGLRVRDRMDILILGLLTIGVGILLMGVMPNQLSETYNVFIASCAGSLFAFLYEGARVIRYSKDNGDVAMLLRNTINPLYFGSQLLRD